MYALFSELSFFPPKIVNEGRSHDIIPRHYPFGITTTTAYLAATYHRQTVYQLCIYAAIYSKLLI